MSDTPKRQPLLADRYLASRGSIFDRHWHPKAIDRIHYGIRHAVKFKIDEEATHHIARIVMEIPELLVREYRFAFPPFDITWIEWPSWHFWMDIRGRDAELYNRMGIWGDPDTADYEVGYLIDNGRVNVVSCLQGKNAVPAISPLQFRLNTEWPEEDQLEYARLIGTSRIGIDAYLWGSSYHAFDQDQRRLLRAYNLCEFLPPNPNGPAYEKWIADGGMASVARGSVGELRTIIALLLVLNRPSLITYVRDNPNTRGWYRSKVVPYLSHRVVTMHLDPVPTLRHIGTSRDAVERRRGPVKGHFCHDHVAREYQRIAGCIHDFRPTHDDWTPWDAGPGDDVRHWVCAACEGKRWHRRPHHRGSAAKGWIIRDGYEVTP